MDSNTSKSHTFSRGDLAILITTFLWAFGVVIIKSAIGTTPETFRIFVFNGLRIPVVSFLLFLFVKLKGGTIGLRREHILLVAVIAFVGMFMNMVTGLTMQQRDSVGEI